MKTYEVKSGGDWMRVKGRVNVKGWLEWKTRIGEVGISQPGSFRPLQKRKQAAITLVETLIYIAVAAVLVAMFLPALARANRRANLNSTGDFHVRLLFETNGFKVYRFEDVGFHYITDTRNITIK